MPEHKMEMSETLKIREMSFTKFWKGGSTEKITTRVSNLVLGCSSKGRKVDANCDVKKIYICCGYL